MIVDDFMMGGNFQTQPLKELGKVIFSLLLRKKQKMVLLNLLSADFEELNSLCSRRCRSAQNDIDESSLC